MLLCAGFTIAIAGQTPSAPPDRQPRQVNPPRQPADNRPRLALALGMTVLPWTNYRYQTTVTLPSGSQLVYSGSGAAPGITAFAGPTLTLPGPLRRLTLGVDLSAGGLYTLGNPVVPANASVPFSSVSLQQSIKLEHSFGQGWRAFASPYIEHDIAAFHDNKLRLGYQFLTQSAQYTGDFPAGLSDIPNAAYDVQLHYRAHLVRFSWSNFLYADDYGHGGQPSERRTGLLRQMGICAGTGHTVVIFFAIGPIWDL